MWGIEVVWTEKCTYGVDICTIFISIKVKISMIFWVRYFNVPNYFDTPHLYTALDVQLLVILYNKNIGCIRDILRPIRLFCFCNSENEGLKFSCAYQI